MALEDALKKIDELSGGDDVLVTSNPLAEILRALALQEKAKPEGEQTGFYQVCTCKTSSHPDLCPIHGKPTDGVTTCTSTQPAFVPMGFGEIKRTLMETSGFEMAEYRASEFARALFGKVGKQERNTDDKLLYLLVKQERAALREWKRKVVEVVNGK